MSNEAGNSLQSPRFLQANNPKDLQEAMLRNNLEWRMEFNYFDIQFAKGKWYVWYYFNHKRLREKADNDS